MNVQTNITVTRRLKKDLDANFKFYGDGWEIDDYSNIYKNIFTKIYKKTSIVNIQSTSAGNYLVGMHDKNGYYFAEYAAAFEELKDYGNVDELSMKLRINQLEKEQRNAKENL